ncbi:MAG: peroxidase family protein [Cyanobium sp. D14.bin.5]|nr:peroxidase family protein [Cyanobium sp. D14.bin.5]
MTYQKLDSVIDAFTVEDLFFLRYQYRVYEEWNNDPRLAVLPGVNANVVGAKVTSGIRFVDGSDQLRYQVGGGTTPAVAPFPVSTTDPKFMAGATGTLFRRLTSQSFSNNINTLTNQPKGGFTINFSNGAVNYNPAYGLDYAVRGYTTPSNPFIFDASPRIISNLVSNQNGKTALQVQDDPYARQWTQTGTQAGKRVSQRNNTRHETILTGGDGTANSGNPLPNSGFFALFGQYNDHGLDFLSKGNDGSLLIPLLPGDSLYTPGSATNFMALSRTNTVQVVIGEGSRDALVAELGLAGFSRPTQWNVKNENAAVGTSFNGTSGGTLVLNEQLILITPGATLADVVTAINTKAAFTGVVATTTTNGSDQSVLKLIPRNGESINQTSAFLDLNQVYASVESHGIFIREYNNQGKLTGRLLTDSQNSTARWIHLKQNALRIGLTLHDRDVQSVPLVERIPQGIPNAGRYAFVALDKVSGLRSYLFDTAALTSNQVLVKAGAAFLIDLAPNWKGAPLPAGVDPFFANGDLKDPTRLNQHAVGGDGRLNENIGLTSLHEIFVTTHNNILAQIESDLPNNQSVTGEELFQLAKLANENFYQHHVVQEYARRITPNLGANAGVSAANNNNAGFNASILTEFASSAFRFGHSQLTETMALNTVNQQTGLANPGGQQNITLLQAFLAPQLYTNRTAGQIAAGMSQQVGNATDEYITNTLRNALIGLPLDLAALNIARGLDTGITPLNEARREIQTFLRNVRTSPNGTSGLVQANNGIDTALADLEANLRPYISWRDFGDHLLNPDSLKGFIMAYARDALLSGYQGKSLSYWNNLQASTASGDAATYAAALSAAADAAMANPSFMGLSYTGTVADALNPVSPANIPTTGNRDYEAISLWLGGLAEAKTPGGMLGPTHDFIYAYQMQQLQRGDEAYYLSKLAGTDLVEEIKGKTVADMVMAATGVKHLYHKIFAVNDADYERSLQTFATFASETALFSATQTVVDANGVQRQVGRAGYVNGVLTGNNGNYLDARGVFNPNGVGNASEMFGGTDGADKFKGLGGDDCMWGDGGNDLLEGGNGNDFVDGGTGNDSIYGGNGFDMLRGDAGNDLIYGGTGNDDMYGGEGNDNLFGEDGNDDLNGGNGNDLVSGGLGADLVKGQAGNDTLIGGQGVDTITGGGGNDRFVFNEPLNVTGTDQIRDFGLGADQLVFNKTTYTGLSGSTITAAQFLADAGAVAATTAAQRFIYNPTTGDLRFDADGNGVGASTLIANLNRFNPAFPSDTASANALFPTLTTDSFLLV